jgi:hypothetical protein
VQPLVCRFNNQDLFHEHSVYSEGRPNTIHLTVWVHPEARPTQLSIALRDLSEHVDAYYNENAASVFHFPPLSEQERRSVPLPLIARLRPGMTKALALACIRKARAQIRKRYAVPEREGV